MRYYHDPSNGTRYPNGAIVYRTRGPFASLARIERCPCDDNETRLVDITGEPDTMFSVPARVRVRGKWVSGFVMFDSGAYLPEGPRFAHHSGAKNGALIRPEPYKDARVMAEMGATWSARRTPAQRLRAMFPADFL